MTKPTFRHPISGDLVELSREEFLALFSRPLHKEILRKAARPGVEIVVCFEPFDEDPSITKIRSAVNFGPGCTYGVEELAKGCRLGETVDDIRYPVYFWRAAPTEPASSANSAAGPKRGAGHW